MEIDILGTGGVAQTLARRWAAAGTRSRSDRETRHPGTVLSFRYPMLDDRNTTPDPEIAPFAVWSYDDNITGWGALLGDAISGPDVTAYAAPARATDLSGLPATYIEVG